MMPRLQGLDTHRATQAPTLNRVNLQPKVQTTWALGTSGK